MLSLVYRSRAVGEPDSGDLVELLGLARLHNERVGITGLLLFADGTYLQQLEGRRDLVEDLFTAIDHDPRHEDVRVLTSRRVVMREFPDWSMGFMDSEPDELATYLDGYHPPTRVPLAGVALAVDGPSARSLFTRLSPATRT